MSTIMTNLSTTPSGLTGACVVEARARGLLDALRKSPSCLDPSIPAAFDRLLRFAESLHVVGDELDVAHNWIVGARDLWEHGEPRAALYQVKLACRRLESKTQ